MGIRCKTKRKKEKNIKSIPKTNKGKKTRCKNVRTTTNDHTIESKNANGLQEKRLTII